MTPLLNYLKMDVEVPVWVCIILVVLFIFNAVYVLTG